MYAAYRPAQPGHLYYRFAHFVMPFWTLFPNGPLGDNILAQAWVPMDDTHTMVVHSSMWNGARPRRCDFTKTASRIPQLDRISPTLPNTTDWFGRWRPVANQSNDYLIDREAQRTDQLHRHRRGLPAGFGDDREHGRDLRPHARDTWRRATG